jgi:hypothetical protein
MDKISLLSYNTLNTINSIEKKSLKSEKDIGSFDYIKFIEKNFFLKLNNLALEDLSSYINLYNLNRIYKLYPAIRKNSYGIFSYLFILDIISYYKQYTNDIDFSTEIWVDTLLYYIDLINLKTLYIETNGKEKYYLSPLNNRRFRTSVIKIKLDDDTYINEKINLKINSIIDEFKNNGSIIKDCNDYDIVIVTSHYNYGNLKYEIELMNFDKNKDFNSCILLSTNNPNDTSHIISITKCNDNFVLNTTWSEYNTKKVNNFYPFMNKNFILKDKSYLSQNSDDENENYKYNTKLITTNYILEIFYNIYFFSNKINNKDYKTLSFGGDNYNITDEKCLNIMNTINDDGFCWLSSIINSLCYSDKTSILIYKKSERFIKKIITYIQNFIVYKYYLDLDAVLAHNYYHILSLYIHSSYYLLKTNKLDINEMKKFAKKMELIIDNYYLIILYSYIITMV